MPTTCAGSAGDGRPCRRHVRPDRSTCGVCTGKPPAAAPAATPAPARAPAFAGAVAADDPFADVAPAASLSLYEFGDLPDDVQRRLADDPYGNHLIDDDDYEIARETAVRFVGLETDGPTVPAHRQTMQLHVDLYDRAALYGTARLADVDLDYLSPDEVDEHELLQARCRMEGVDPADVEISWPGHPDGRRRGEPTEIEVLGAVPHSKEASVFAALQLRGMDPDLARDLVGSWVDGRLDDTHPPYRADLQEAFADVSHAHKATAEWAERQSERAASLYEREVESFGDVDTLKGQYEDSNTLFGADGTPYRNGRPVRWH